MVTITTERATVERWDDVQQSLTGGGDGASCQCIWPVVRNKDWQATNLDQRRQMFHDEVVEGPPPGIVAYVDGEAAGWIRVGPRTRQLRLVNTRAIVAATSEPLDDDRVWAVSCFVVRREHRGKGVNAPLLDAAVEYAADSGARVLEAYPIATGGEKAHSNDLFHGVFTTFLAAGFRHTGDLKPGRPLVTRELSR